MRVLPCKSLGGVSEYVLGVSLIRGQPTPVVDLRRLLGIAAPEPPAQLVLVRCGERRAALAVDRVFGLRSLADDAASTPRGVLTEMSKQQLQSLRRLDG